MSARRCASKQSEPRRLQATRGALSRRIVQSAAQGSGPCVKRPSAWPSSWPTSWTSSSRRPPSSWRPSSSWPQIVLPFGVPVSSTRCVRSNVGSFQRVCFTTNQKTFPSLKPSTERALIASRVVELAPLREWKLTSCSCTNSCKLCNTTCAEIFRIARGAPRLLRAAARCARSASAQTRDVLQ